MRRYNMNIYKKLRKEHNLTQVELAKILNVNQATVSKWESGETIPDYTTLKNLANLYRISIDKLLDNDIDKNIESVVISHNVVKIPVYGSIPAGVPTEMIDESFIEDFEEIDADMLRGGNSYFGLVVKGDSMFPEFRNGDVLILKQSPDCESGDYCAVSINCTESTFKKVIKEPNGIVLQPLNPAFTPQFFTNEQIENLPITILGVVVEVRRKYK